MFVNDDRVKRIEEFIKKMDQHDIEFTDKSASSYVEDQQNTLGQIKQKVTGTLSDHLSKALMNYQDTKLIRDQTFGQSFHNKAISEAILWINRAETLGAVKPSQGIFTKYQSSLKDVEKKQQDNETLYAELRSKETEYAELFGRYKELNEKLQNIFAKKEEQ